jgi:large subunit ribosomal protein L4
MDLMIKPVITEKATKLNEKLKVYTFRVSPEANKYQIKQLARKSALTVKAQDGQIIVVDNINLDAVKTKDFVNITKNLKVNDKKVLFVLSDKNNNVYLSARNVPNTYLMSASDINTYALLNNNAIVMTEGSLELINKL